LNPERVIEIPQTATAAAAVAAFREAALHRHFGLIPSRELPDLAIRALEASIESPSLLELAGELLPSWSDSGPLFERILDELGVAGPSAEGAPHELARYYATQILSGTLTPYEGAHEIWLRLVTDPGKNNEHWIRYGIFTNLETFK
jgi:hypothetical protein